MTAATNLRNLLESAGAAFGAWQGIETALDFGDPQAEYRALTDGAGVVDRSDCVQIEIRGADRARFLHNMCTNDILKLTPGSGCEAFFTDAKSHILAYVYLFCRPDSLVLETVPSQNDRLVQHLGRYIIREDVQLLDQTRQWAELLVSGRGSIELLQKLVDGSLPEVLLNNAPLQLGGKTIWLCRAGLCASPNFLVSCLAEDVAEVWQNIRDAGAVACGMKALETARIEAGVPFYGQDIGQDNLPQEVARDRQAISFNKGCYLGQETVARIKSLGHVNRTLVALRFKGQQVPAATTELTAQGQPVGRVTSAVFSPRLGAPLALGYVRAGKNSVGSVVACEVGEAEVIGFPL